MLTQAISLHREGKFADASALYRQILSQQPSNADALHLLGLIELQMKNASTALALIDRAVGFTPNSAIYLTSRGNALLALNRLEEALTSYARALAASPTHVEALNNRGVVLQKLKRHTDALASYDRALVLRPDYADSLNNRGLALQSLGRTEEALASYERALAIRPEYAEALTNRGNALQELERFEEALASFDAALAVRPNYAEAANNRGNALKHLKRLDEALASFDRALALQPNYAEAHNNRGVALQDLKRHEDALAAFSRALSLKPNYAEAFSNKGLSLQAMQRFEDAIASYERALTINPNESEALVGRSTVRLLLGDFAGGWKDYSHRDSMKTVGSEVHRALLATDLSGQRILVLPNQGLGDEIFFLRFAVSLKSRGATVFYRANEKIAGMIARSGAVDHVVGAETPSDVSMTISVGDLPHLLGMSKAAEIPPPLTLPPLPAALEAMAARLRALGPPPYIGVTWRAGTENLRHALYKEAPRAGLARALAETSGTVLALQRLPQEGEIEAFAAELGRAVHDLTDLNISLEDMLAAMALIDEYVCVSNTNVHLRAGVGRTSRVLMPTPPEFRWMAAGQESPWFPGTRIYRQGAMAPLGDWTPALADLKNDLK